MKAIIFIATLLMSYSFCGETAEVKKSGFYSFAESSYSKIDVSKYSQNDVIHIVFYVYDGEMDKTISYSFSDSKLDESFPSPYSKSASSAKPFCFGDNDDYFYYRDRECGYKYNYDIEKKENKRYIIIHITGYTGTSLTSQLISKNYIVYYIIFGVIIVIILISIFMGIFSSCRRRARMKNIVSNPSSTQTALVPTPES